MAVAVYHSGDDSLAGSVDDDGVRGKLRLVCGIPDPLDAVAGDKDAHADAQLRPGPVSKGGITVKGAHLGLAGLWVARMGLAIRALSRVCRLCSASAPAFEPQFVL